MSIRKRGETYHYDFQVRGERFRGTTGTGDRVAAQEIHDDLKAKAWRRNVKNERLFLEAVTSYFQGRSQSGSWKDDVRRADRLREWTDGKFCAEVTRELAHTIVTQMKLRGLKPPTINRYLTLLIAIMNHAADLGWVDQPPRIKKVSEGPGRLVYLTPDEVDRLIEALPEQVHKDFVTLAIATGLRMRNLTHLEWSEVNLFNRTIAISAEKMKARKPLVIPINQMAMDVLQRLHRPSGRVLQYRGRDLDVIGRRAFKTAQNRAGLTKNIHPHVFRHTFASWHIQSGTSIYELKELGGWSKLDSVMQYAHLNIDHLKESSAKISQLFLS